MASVLAAAWTYGSAAYSYNMGRFQFDAGQRQATAHQIQNMRMSLWNLFREDIRDLFGITTSNMSTYMIIATLFLGFIVNMLWNGVKDFPEQPIWLIFFYVNSFCTSVGFGVLSIWLAMHGTITAHAASVKVLTQAVRPPIPSSAVVSNVRSDLNNYESANVATFLQIPNLFNWQQPSSVQQNAETEMQSMSVESSEMQDEHVNAINDSDHAPGPSALLGAHIELFRDLQQTYLGFEAYSRVSLTVAAYGMLINFAYFSLAHLNAWRSERTGNAKHCELTGWCLVCFMSFTAQLLFKLDLFVEKWDMRVLKILLFAGPLLTSLAVSLWSRDNDSGRDLKTTFRTHVTVLAACFVHLLWELMILWEARPGGGANLPVAFRAIQYTDLFGWWYKGSQDVQTGTSGTADETIRSEIGAVSMPDNTLDASHMKKQLLKLSQPVATLISQSGALSVAISAKEIQSIHDVHAKLESCLKTLPDAADVAAGESGGGVASFEGDAHMNNQGNELIWLESTFVSDSGQILPYYVNSKTAEVQWNAPEVGQIVNLSFISKSVDELCQHAQKYSNADPHHTRPARRVKFSKEEVVSEDPGGTFQPRARWDQFKPMPRRPNSRYEVSSMAWKYFWQVGCLSVGLWAVTFAWIAFHGIEPEATVPDTNTTGSPTSFVAFPKECGDGETGVASALKSQASVVRSRLLRDAIPSTAAILPVEWPRRFHQPSGLACTETTFVLGERFRIHVTSFHPLPNATLRLANFAAVTLSMLMPTSWSAFEVIGSSGGMLFVVDGGRAVLEMSNVTVSDLDSASMTRWELSPSADLVVQAITRVTGGAVIEACGSLVAGAHDWALYAATAQGEVVSLCPWKETLVPVLVISKLAEADATLIGITHKDDKLYLLVQLGIQAEVRRLTLDGLVDATWKLPSDRRWGRGLCLLGEGNGLLAAATHEQDRMLQSEIWHLQQGFLRSNSQLV